MDVVPRFEMSFILLLLIVFAVVVSFVFLARRFGKDKGWVVGLGIVGLILGVMWVVFRMVFGMDMLAPLVILPIIVGVGLVIFALVKAGGGKAAVGGIVAGVIALLVVLGLLYFVSVPVSHRTEIVERPMPVVNGDEPAVWHEGMEDGFAADVYPSKRAAMFAVVKRATGEGSIQSILADERISREIWLLADDHDTGLLSELARRIGELLSGEGATCRVMQNADKGEWDIGTVDSDVMQLLVQVRFGFEDVETDRASWGGDVSGGKVVMQVKGPESLSATTVRFEEKPWVENFSEFLNKNPDFHVTLIRSSDSCTSQAQAHQQVIAQACSQVSGIMRGMQADTSVLPANFNLATNEITSEGLILDRFTQRFSGMAGPIWREAILVDTSEKKLSALADKKIDATRARRQSWGQMALTLVGMFVLISVVYMFLNAATRGYYSWALRIALIVLMGVGVFLVLMFVA